MKLHDVIQMQATNRGRETTASTHTLHTASFNTSLGYATITKMIFMNLTKALPHMHIHAHTRTFTHTRTRTHTHTHTHTHTRNFMYIDLVYN